MEPQLGKSAPTPPPAPDPTQVAQAQTTSNLQTAQAQSTLNNTNIQSPYGSVTYSQPGGPNSQWTQTTTLSPAEQAIFNGETSAAAGAVGTASQQIGRVDQALGQSLQAPTLQTSANVGDLATGYSPGGSIAYGFNPGGAIQPQVASTYSPFSSLGGLYGLGGAGSAPTSPTPGQPNAGGNASVNPTMAAVASNPVLGTQLATYAQAAQMLNPQWQQAGEQEQAQLTAQGLNPNDAAYQNAMQIFGNQENNAYNQAMYGAINAGDTEQNTLFGQNLGAGQFANAAQQQGYNENLGQAQFANTAQAQANSQNAQAAAFQNAALGQNWQEQYQNAQLANQAAQQQFQDQAYAQELPINEFNSLMSSGQVSAPSSSPAQTAVAPTNVLGAYQMQQNTLQNDYNDEVQNNASGLGGLFNLGSAAMSTFGL